MSDLERMFFDGSADERCRRGVAEIPGMIHDHLDIGNNIIELRLTAPVARMVAAALEVGIAHGALEPTSGAPDDSDRSR